MPPSLEGVIFKEPIMAADSPFNRSRREALRCLAFGGAGTLFALSAGVLVPMDLASAAKGETTQGFTTGTIERGIRSHDGLLEDDPSQTRRQAPLFPEVLVFPRKKNIELRE